MKSHASDYLRVMQAIYSDACVECAAEVSIRDLKTIRSRVKSQGVSFLTITLPNFCKDFERSLEQGFVDSKLFQSFRKNRAIPAFLQGMLSRIFDLETGRIIDDVKANGSPINTARLVGSIRQICLAFKKIELACTPLREFRAMESFVENEAAFELFSLSEEDVIRFSNVSFVLWNRVLRDLRVDELVPRHGPGQTAERVSGNRKYSWQRWHDRLEPYFPFVDSAYSQSIYFSRQGQRSCGVVPISTSEIGSSAREELNLVSVISEDDEQPVRVTPVPKTLKGPRIIAIEPCCMQYAQQAIRDILYERLESHEPFAGHINFRDQTKNQRLALMSSANGLLATIDLSDASDRVPLDLALRMFDSNPDLRDAIDACRSKNARMPDGRNVRLSKFASMGSALCFPVEAMYFYTICVVALLEEFNLPVSRKNAELVASDVYVYGDDILVPAHAAASVLKALQKYNCRVNSAKTFYRGSFRESCGVDAYLGEVVTPLYIGTKPPENRQQAKSVISWLCTSNLFFKKGYFRTASFLASRVEKVLGKLPAVPEKAAVLGRTIPWTLNRLRRRWNEKLQHFEVMCWVPSPVYRTDKLDGFGALQKSLLRLERKGYQKPDMLAARQERFCAGDHFDAEAFTSLASQLDPAHLERSALHGEVAINRRWVPATLVSGYRQ